MRYVLLVILSLLTIVSAEPDLYIVGAFTVPETLPVGQGFELHYTLENAGDAVVNSTFVVEASVGEEVYDLYIDDPIAPGERIEMIDRGWAAFMTPGVYDIVLTADVYENVSESNEDNNAHESTVEVVSTNGIDPTPLIIIAVAVVLIFLYIAKSKKSKPVGTKSEIRKLQDEKKKIERILEMAKVKYYKRTLDEQSYREIVRDHQKRLMEVERDIAELQERVEKIEKKLE